MLADHDLLLHRYLKLSKITPHSYFPDTYRVYGEEYPFLS
jgi:hypothetical protein